MAAYTEIEFLRTLNQTFYDQVKTADQKAGYVCTFLTILFAYSKDHGQALTALTAMPALSLSWLMSVAFVVAACFSIVCTVLVILPRSKPGGSALYWGAWAGDHGLGEKLSGDISDEHIMSEYLTNIKNLAQICQAKYKFVNLSFRGTAATILIYIAIVVLAR